jgi:putative transcriptional regulator
MALVRRRIDPAKVKLSGEALARIDALTPADIEGNAREDLDNPPLTAEELARGLFGRRVRKKRVELGLSQVEFAREFELSVATVRDWEQGRTRPGKTAQSFMALLERMSKTALRSASGPHDAVRRKGRPRKGASAARTARKATVRQKAAKR